MEMLEFTVTHAYCLKRTKLNYRKCMNKMDTKPVRQVIVGV
jgi:hypothetical protein